jgi:general secretion pathway protein L
MQHLLYNPDTGEAVFWRSGQQEFLRGQLADLAVAKGPVTVFISGSRLLLTHADIPARQQQRIVQAVPYALEENLCEDVDALHFAVGKRGDCLPVAVLRRADMTRILKDLEAWECPLIIPALLALPWQAESWTLVALRDGLLVRMGACEGFWVGHDEAQNWLSLALADAPKQIEVYAPDNAELNWDLLLQGRAYQHHKQHAETCLGAPSGFNLRQGEFAPVSQLQAYWRPWRLTAALASIWLVAYLGLLGLEVQQLKQQRQNLRDDMIALYRDTFPQARHIVNPKLQMERALAQLQDAPEVEQASFLAQLQSISIVFAPIQGLFLQRLDYRDGAFECALKLPGLQVLETLKQKLAEHGLQAEIRGAESRNNEVEARLRIQAL